MNNMSVADVMALTQGEDQNNWLFFLLFFVLFGGGDFMGRAKQADAVDNATILGAVQGNREAIASIQYATGVNQAELVSGLAGLGNAINSVALRGDQNTDRVVSAITAGSVEILTQLASCCCETQKSILETKYELGQRMDGGFAAINNKIDASTYALADRINGSHNALTAQITNQGFQMERGFAAIETSMLNQQLQATRDRLLETQGSLSNCHQTAAIVQAIQNPVVHVPTWPVFAGAYGAPYASAHTGGVNINKATNRAQYDVQG